MISKISVFSFFIGLYIVVFGISDLYAQSNVNPNDLKQAREFLSQLSPLCKNSSISTSTDGTVIVHILCENKDKSMDGTIEIKNGIVKKIR